MRMDMEREQLFKEWLPGWKPKNAGANFTGNVWSESTLSSYTNVLKNIVTDLGIDDPQVKKNLFDYTKVMEYLIAYGKITNHAKFNSLQYFPIAKKALKRYQDFLYESK